MQTNANAVDRAVATALDGVLVRGEHNMLADPPRPAWSERRAYTHDSEHETMSERSEGRSICICRFIAEQVGWRQVYHQVSLDDPDQLARYQRAVRRA